MEDEQIVTLYWERNEQAISETQAKYDRYLQKIANNILNNLDDSRESVNDTYLAAWESMPPHRPQCAVRLPCQADPANLHRPVPLPNPSQAAGFGIRRFSGRAVGLCFRGQHA